jgi:hypothetical protein
VSVDVPSKQVAFLAAESEAVIETILDDLQVSAKVDDGLLRQVTSYFLRDVYRLDQQQRGSVSLAKYAGYWGFWVRKLKPISSPMLQGDFLTKDELEFINEIVSVYLAVQLVMDWRQREGMVQGSRGYESEIVRSQCSELNPGNCDGVVCFERFVGGYLHFHKKFFMNYITYSMRNRTFGPHHFALLMEGLIYAACPVVSGGDHA